MKSTVFYTILLIFISGGLFAQIQEIDQIKPDAIREQMFFPYLAVRHGGFEGTAEWKKSNTVKYYQELWYYSQSFYVKRNHLEKGVELDESIIDISRFESERMGTTEKIVILPGFKDVLVLLPAKDLKYKPEYIK